MTIQTSILERDVDYDGSQLRSLFAFDVAGVAGDSLVAFRGACDVLPQHVVDREDLLLGHGIKARSMLHFIAEHFEEGLSKMVLRQRLFARIAGAELARACGRPVDVAGDDLFLAGRKASVSIATVSPVSGVFHFAIDLDPHGAPVPAVGLDELGVEWRPFAQRLLDLYRDECEGMARAVSKVRWVQ
jgi:hypothetical protein